MHRIMRRQGRSGGAEPPQLLGLRIGVLANLKRQVFRSLPQNVGDITNNTGLQKSGSVRYITGET
jgi:hypothetical protein